MTVRALVVGSLVMDLAFRVSARPGPGEVIIADEFGQYRGGKGYNQAVALARMGAEVAIIGAVGRDAHGDELIAALTREGVDASRVLQLRATRTAIAVPLITPDGDVGFVQYPGANRELAPAHCAEIPDCDVLFLQGEIAASTSLHAARVIRKRGGIVLLNPAPVHVIDDPLLDAATVLVPNEVEARALADSDVGGAEAARLLHRPGQVTVVTLGARGAAWTDDRGSGTLGPPAVNAVDATGAGDSFCAALGLALAEGRPTDAAVAFACAAGAHAATVAGAEPGLPTRQDIEQLLVI